MKIIRSFRKSVSFSFSDDGELIVAAPIFVNNQKILEILSQNRDKIEKMRERKEAFFSYINSISEEKLIEKAKEKIENRLPLWEEKLGLFPKSVKITSAKGRYGSCSEKGSICFSKYLFLRTDEEIDYVFIHELAHLKEMNHGENFYKIIESVMPDYKIHRTSLKKPLFLKGGEK